MKANCRALKASIIISSIFLVLIIIFTLLVLNYDNKLFEVLLNIFIGLFGSGCVALLLAIPAYNVYLTSWLFKKCLDDNFDFNVYIKPTTYIIATIGTFLVSYLVSLILSKKIKKIDMVSSLKGNE